MGWVYQLAIYAVASAERTAVILYPTEDPAAHEERVRLLWRKAKGRLLETGSGLSFDLLLPP